MPGISIDLINGLIRFRAIRQPDGLSSEGCVNVQIHGRRYVDGDELSRLNFLTHNIRRQVIHQATVKKQVTVFDDGGNEARKTTARAYRPPNSSKGAPT